jgi:hypothetical protein
VTARSIGFTNTAQVHAKRAGHGRTTVPRSRLDALSDAVFCRDDAACARRPATGGVSSGKCVGVGAWLLALWPKFFPCVLSFLVLGLRWLANVQLRTRSEWFGREYAVWWTAPRHVRPIHDFVVGRFVMFALAIWLFAGNTLRIAAVAFRLLALTELEPGDHRRDRQMTLGVLACRRCWQSLGASIVHAMRCGPSFSMPLPRRSRERKGEPRQPRNREGVSSQGARIECA